MNNSKRRFALSIAAAVVSLGLAPAWSADGKGSAQASQAMVDKAIAFIKKNGREKAFAEINNPKGQFTDRDLYVVVYDINGKVLAHGANAKMIGRDLLDNKDVDVVCIATPDQVMRCICGMKASSYRFE